MFRAMKTCGFLAVALAVLGVAGCEHKNKRDDQTTTASGSPTVAKPAAGTGEEMKPEPVAREPSPNPAPNGDEPRPPTAADLAAYTKDMSGSGPLQATIETSMGTIHCELFGDKAPMTVANFVGLATGKKAWMNPSTHQLERGKPYFDGLTFHRVIPGFMIQGGDPLGRGIGGPGYQFANEIDRSLKMDPGALAMANAGPDTNGSQFFIMEGSKPGLVGGYSIFGQCKEVDVVKSITAVPRDSNDKPDSPVTIKHVEISKG